MKYYRLIFKNTKNGPAISEITEGLIDTQTFESMNWERPIVKHFDGKYNHYLSLDSSYLEAMLAGISAINESQNLPID
jgi:hypothetical protein